MQTLLDEHVAETTDLQTVEAGKDSRDRDLEGRVRNYLLGYKMPALQHVDVVASRGLVILRGRVYSFFQKQLCIHCCQRVAGVFELVDQLQVAPAAAARRVLRPR